MITYKTVTKDDLQKIVNLYKEICDGATRWVDVDTLLEQIRKQGKGFSHDGYRIGSTWDGHSKLRFGIDYVTGQLQAIMNENFDPRDRNNDNQRYVDALAAAEKFRQAVLELTS